MEITNGLGIVGRDTAPKWTRRHMIRLSRCWCAIALTGVVAVGAVLVGASPGFASTGGALGARTAANMTGPTQCEVPSENRAGCTDSNPLLGPKELPKTGPAGSVDGDIAKMTRGYHPFGTTTKAAFLDLYYNGLAFGTEPPGTWKYPPDGGFAIDPTTWEPRYEEIKLEPSENGKPVFVDRFGRDTGMYLAPAGTPYAERSVPPNSLDTFYGGAPYNYHLYRVMKAFHVDVGRIAPWFGQEGGGLQYTTCVTKTFECSGKPDQPNVAELVKNEILEVVPLEPPPPLKPPRSDRRRPAGRF